jgi:hypothetical protein
MNFRNRGKHATAELFPQYGMYFWFAKKERMRLYAQTRRGRAVT